MICTVHHVQYTGTMEASLGHVFSVEAMVRSYHEYKDVLGCPYW